MKTFQMPTMLKFDQGTSPTMVIALLKLEFEMQVKETVFSVIRSIFLR